MLRVGDYLIYRSGFGMDDPALIKVKSLEVTEEPREKYGEDRDEVSWDLVRSNHVLITTEDGHWIYSDQVEIEASKQARQYMKAPVDVVVRDIGRLHPLIAKARLNPQEA